MANKRQTQRQQELDMGLTPSWPTTMKTFYPNGMCIGTDNSVWLYMQVGMGSVADAKNKLEAVEVGEALMSAYDELALMSIPVRDQRNLSRASYRTTKLMLVNIPHAFMPPKGHPNAEWLYRNQRSSIVQKRVLLLGVKLRDSLTTEGIGMAAAARAFASSVVSGSVPIEFYTKDYKRVRQAMERAGLHVAAPESIRLANAWFNQGDFPDVPTVPHAKHIHFLRTDGAIRDFEAQKEAGNAKDCRDWPSIAGSHIISFASVTQTNLLFNKIDEPSSHWLVDIVDDGAMCVSITAKIEPAQVTRKELNTSKKKILADAQEKLKNNKSVRSEEDDALGHISYLIDSYGKGAGRSSSPTLYDTSIVVGFAGKIEDMQTVARNSKANLALMDHRQQAAMTETMLCSGVTANPNLHELPTQAIAHSGIQSLSHIGDNDGALLGYTERDRQPAWLSPTAASSGDDPPIMIVAGQSGSGKALPLSALLPTPTGWTTMGEIAIGDMLLGRDGKPAKVTTLSPIERNPEMFLLSLDYGEQVRATRDHLWTITADWGKLGFDTLTFTLTAKHLHTLSGRLAAEAEAFPSELDVAGALAWLSQNNIAQPYVTPALLMAALDTTDTAYRTSYNHRLYKFGDLLRGLGMRLSQLVNDARMVGGGEAVITTAELQGFASLLPDGIKAFSIRTSEAIEGAHDPSLRDARQSGMRAGIENMPLRQRLLRASVEQRWGLLGGLMDSMGAITGSGSKATYVLRARDIDCAESYAELIGSLGIPVDTTAVNERCYEMAFTTSLTLFDPELEMAVPEAAQINVTHRALLEVVRCASEPARCLSVDSPDASYLCSGFLPTHNTMVLLLLAIQFAMMGSPVVIADPKTDSHHDDTVLAYNGQVLSLDSIANSDSVFDPIFFMGQSERTGGIDEAINLASSLLMSLDLWGAHERGLYEAAIPMALNYGVGAGAKCTGRALELADEARKSGELVGIPEDLWGRIKMVITPSSASMARAIIGMDPAGNALSFSEGISLIKVGRTHLDLPEPGMQPSGLSQKISMALVRMMVYGSVVSVSHRSGVVLLDEGWIFLSAGKSEVIALGRLARHLKVLPIIFTQKITDALDADLEDYLSRGLILPIKNPAEARLALRAFEVEETKELMSRITASAISGGENGGHNWNSMRALVDPEPDPITGKKKVHRGTIGIYIDRARRSVPVEIRLPDGFLDVASTRPEDVAIRKAANAQIVRNSDERKAREAEMDGLHQPAAPRVGANLFDDPDLLKAS